MKFIPTIAALTLFAAQPALAQELDPAVAQQLEETLADGLQPGEANTLYRAAVLAHGDASELIAAVRAQQETVEDTVPWRWLEIDLLRRRGQLAAALGAAERLVELAPNGSILYEQGRLQDALGRRDDAMVSYGLALESLAIGDQLEVDIRLRMALLSMESGEEESSDALAKFAGSEQGDLSLANRAAVVLALLGRPKDAIELYEVGGEGSKLFRSEIRVAEWALEAGEPTVAQEYAWKAVHSATMNRDRWYALTVLVEAHRVDESIDVLIDRFAEADDLNEPSVATWIALLRETERYGEAVELFRDESARQGFTPEARRELLEMYREAGREQEMIDQYLELMQLEPTNWMWPEGLARFYLERGQTDDARALWTSFVNDCPPGLLLIAGAEALMGLGQDDLAIHCAERCIEEGRGRYPAYLFLFDLHRFRGNLALSEAALDRMQEVAPPNAPERMQLAESYERIGNLQRSVDVLEALRTARGAEETSEDLEMRLAWLLSEVGDEDLALERWQQLWRRINSVPRRRYVEDRMMTVAARLGRLADIAIELERRLYAGEADDRDSGLLVRLYTKVGDPVSATEIIEEHLKNSGGSKVDALQEKARVFLACTDYHNYEVTIHELVAIDPEGEPDYLRQIAMSMLERGKPDQAREILTRLKELGGDSDSFEFEAGVLSLAGMRPEAITAYRRGLAEVPDRIESYLLLAELMKQIGQGERAVGMFQHLAETAEKDDLFTIAIDGLLNMEAPAPIMQWARRITLERLARRHDRVYLYQLLVDLGEEVGDMEARYAALEGQLPIAGDRRSSVVRELMDLAAGSTTFFGRSTPSDADRHLAYGRRLIGLGQLVPPQVYLDLGQVFLDNGDVANAVKTFRLARDLPDVDQFRRGTAALFEDARYLEEALATYKKVLIGDSGNVGLLVKVAELEEQLGDDAAGARLYVRAVELLLSRRPLVSGKAEEEEGDAFSRWFARNTDDFDTYYERAMTGLLVTVGFEGAEELVVRHEQTLRDELTQMPEPAVASEFVKLSRYPRIAQRSAFLRKIGLSFGIPATVERADHELLSTFPKDDDLLENLVRTRVRWGMNDSAREILAASGREERELRKLRFLVGDGVDADATDLVPVDEAMRQLLPLLSAGRDAEAASLLRRLDFSGLDRETASGDVGALFSGAIYLQDADLTLYLGRNWLRMMMTDEQPAMSYEVQTVLDRCTLALDGEYLRSLYQYYVQLILDNPEQLGDHLRLIPDLQERLEEPLLEPEQLADILSENGARLYFVMAPLMRLVPEGERASLLSQTWSDVAPTMRPYFLFNLLTGMEGPLGSEVEGLMRDWFKETIKEAELDRYVYQLNGMVTEEVLEYAGDLALDVLAMVEEQEGSDALAPALRSLALWRLDRREEALPLAVEIYFHKQLVEGTEYYHNTARREIEREILVEMPEPFFAKMDEDDAASPPDLARSNQRLNLVRQLEDPELTLSETRKAAALHEDDLGMQRRLMGALSGAGLREESEALFAQLLERFPDDAALARQAFSRWDSRVHAVRADEARARMTALEEANPEEGEGVVAIGGSMQVMRIGSVSGSAAILMTPSGQIVQGATSDEEDEDGRIAPATVKRLKEAVEAEDWETARNQLRRLWRIYPSGNNRGFGMVYYYGSSMGRGLNWPQDQAEEVEQTEEEKAEAEELQRQRRRGGLTAYTDEVVEPTERIDGYEVLSAYDFAIDEMQRQIRSNGPAGMESLGPVISGLAGARVREIGAEAAIDELIAAATAGTARRFELLQLLSLLEEHPEAFGEEAATVLDDLERSLHPRDGAQLLRLARVMAATGARERAVDLYRWCATQTSASRYFSMRQGDFGSIQLHMLVNEVKETLGDGEDLEQVIEDVLSYSSPVEYPWEREQHQLLEIDTWTELLDPARALERCAEIVAAADNRDEPLRRGVADKAAWLYAHEAEFDRAIECLEAAICSFPAGSFASDRWNRQRDYPKRSFGQAQMRRFLPSDAEGWKQPAEWAVLLGDTLMDWADADRLRVGDALRGAALAAVRAHEYGDSAGAQALLLRASQMLGEEYGSALWVADAARTVGLGVMGDEIEAAQLTERRLNVHRISEVAARMLDAGDAAAVLALGADLREYTLHPDLVELMLVAAEATQDADALTEWSELKTSSEAAQERIDAWREEEKRKAEEARASR